MPVRERPIAPESSDISRRVGIPLMVFFIAMLTVPIVVQPVYEITAKHEEESTKERAAREQERKRLAAAGEKVAEDKLPKVASRLSRIQALDILRGQPTLEHIEKFEDAIADEALIANIARPYTQLVALSAMRQGNEKVMVGRDGWLFHRPGVFYVTGYSFRSKYAREDSPGKLREEGKTDWDPLPAILSLKAQLESRGIELVLAPIPVKAQVYPGKLTRLYDTSKGPAANLYSKEFLEYLPKPKGLSDLELVFNGFRRRVDRKNLGEFFAYLGDPEEITDTQALEHARAFKTGGIDVVDLSGALWKAKAEGQVYLNLDTHWTPFGMKSAAKALADELRARYPWLAERQVEHTTRKQTVTRHGDLFYMLDLPPWSKAFPEHTVEIEQVIDAAKGEPVSRDNTDSPVVLLGDSFTNVFSTQENDERGMRWGEHAGFGEHLMKELGRPIEVIAFNGGAPTATRQELARRAGRRGLEGKKLVIWSFATRELITPATEWRQVILPSEPGEARAAAAGAVEVVAEVEIASDPPTPRVDPYPEAVTLTKYKVVSVEKGTYGEKELLAAEWVMREFKLTRAARYSPGDVHRLKLIPFADAEKADPSLRQAKTLDDTNEYALDLFWVVEMTPAESD